MLFSLVFTPALTTLDKYAFNNIFYPVFLIDWSFLFVSTLQKIQRNGYISMNLHNENMTEEKIIEITVFEGLVIH